jgi:hypothetical protein
VERSSTTVRKNVSKCTRDEKFRFSLERDYQELVVSLQNGAWKAAYILAGSIIEAVLIDYLLAVDYQDADPLEMTLDSAIRACSDMGALSEKTEYMIYMINAYKNLINPVKAVRLRESIDEEYVKMSEDVKKYICTFLNEDRWSFRNDNDKERLTYLRNLILSPTIWTSRLKLE